MREYNKVLLVSGREGNTVCRVATLEWLSENGIEYDELFMRKEGDNRSDVIVKTEIYEEHIKGKYNVLFVLDDRPRIVKMWCDLGIYTLNCNQDPYCVVEF